MNGFMQNQPTLEHQNALIGISVEPLTVIAGLQPAVNSQSSSLDSFMEFSQKMLESFANFITSYSTGVRVSFFSAPFIHTDLAMGKFLFVAFSYASRRELRSAQYRSEVVWKFSTETCRQPDFLEVINW